MSFDWAQFHIHLFNYRQSQNIFWVSRRTTYMDNKFKKKLDAHKINTSSYPFGIWFLIFSSCSFDATFIVINSLFTGCGVSSFTSSFGNGSCSSIAICKPPIESNEKKKKKAIKNTIGEETYKIFIINDTKRNETKRAGIIKIQCALFCIHTMNNKCYATALSRLKLKHIQTCKSFIDHISFFFCNA